jgi:hypothetical protein
MLAHVEITTSRASLVDVYSDGPALIGIGDEKPVVHKDTLRLRTPQTLVADLTDGEVHIVAEDGGSLAVSVQFNGAPATHAAAAGRHIILERDGAGIRATDNR